MDPKEREEIRAAAIEAAKRSRAEQGLPEKVTDEMVLQQIASLMRVTAPMHDNRAAA